MDTTQPPPLSVFFHPVIFIAVEVVIIVGILSAPSLSSLRMPISALIPLVGCMYSTIMSAPQTLRMAWGELVGELQDSVFSTTWYWFAQVAVWI